MSDTLQLVVVMPSDQPDRNARPLVDLTPFELSVGNLNDKLKHIGHLLTRSSEVQCGNLNDKLKHIGHSWREVRRPAMWSSSADLNEVNP